jgi:hypothetical protein
VDQCQTCGASLSAELGWCGQCYAVRGAPAPGSPTRHVPATPELARHVVSTRWRKTPTTFGPLGRVACTGALVVPFLFFVVAGVITGGMTIVGAGIWGFIVMPWGLRDVWRAGLRVVG